MIRNLRNKENWLITNLQKLAKTISAPVFLIVDCNITPSETGESMIEY